MSSTRRDAESRRHEAVLLLGVTRAAENQPDRRPSPSNLRKRVRHSETSNFVLATAQLAFHAGRPEISRTFVRSIGGTAEKRPYGSRPCRAANSAHVRNRALPVRTSGARAVGREAADSLRVRCTTLDPVGRKRLAVAAQPAGDFVSELSLVAYLRAGSDYRCRSPRPRRGRYLPDFHRRTRRR